MFFFIYLYTFLEQKDIETNKKNFLLGNKIKFFVKLNKFIFLLNKKNIH